MITRLPRARQAMRSVGPDGRSRYFDELFVAPGPVELATTGDSSYQTLFGAEWVALIDALTGVRRAFRRVSGGWDEYTGDPRLPSVFGQAATESERRLSLAFDQGARAILAYELSGHIYVTRWDTTVNEYRQNVNFSGTDPCLLMDATLADPAGMPAGARAAAQAGVPVLIHWLPTGEWLESALPDSDVVIFYLSADRTKLRARVQRQLYGTVHELLTHGSPLVLDRAQALYGRYQLLVSDEAGEVLAQMLTSDLYIDDELIAPRDGDLLGASVAPEAIRAESDTYPYADEDGLAATLSPEPIEVVGNLLAHSDEEGLSAAVAPEPIEIVGNTYPYDDSDELAAGVAPESPIRAETTTVPHTDEDGLTGGITVENIRVQTV